MKFVFASNYYNHHQKYLCEALFDALGHDFSFIATAQMRPERVKLGYDATLDASFVHHSFSSPKEEALCRSLVDSADVLVAGSAPESLVGSRIRSGKLAFRYTERPLKNGSEPLKAPLQFVAWHTKNPFFLPIYLLCAGAFVCRDYRQFGLFREKAFKWGYFPNVHGNRTVRHNDGADAIKLLWVGRLLDWKHPDDAVRAARILNERGVPFSLKMVGAGDMEQEIRNLIANLNLADKVELIGSKKPDEVRLLMSKSDALLFTSDKREGWGAVVNEAMSEGCVVVASHAAGSVPYLITNGHNGFIYQSGNVSMMAERIIELAHDPARRSLLSMRAHDTIVNTWNPNVAASRILEVSSRLLAGLPIFELYEEGPCSMALPVDDDWETVSCLM